MTGPGNRETRPDVQVVYDALGRMMVPDYEAIAALGELVTWCVRAEEALREAKKLRREIFLATPVRDDTADAHFALEKLSILLHGAVA